MKDAAATADVVEAFPALEEDEEEEEEEEDRGSSSFPLSPRVEVDLSPAKFLSLFDVDVSMSSGVFLSATTSFVLEEVVVVVGGGASLQDVVEVEGPALDVDAKQGAGGGGGDESAFEEGLNAKEAPTIRPERCEVSRARTGLESARARAYRENLANVGNSARSGEKARDFFFSGASSV